jgi:hypothetical protein
MTSEPIAVDNIVIMKKFDFVEYCCSCFILVERINTEFIHSFLLSFSCAVSLALSFSLYDYFRVHQHAIDAIRTILLDVLFFKTNRIDILSNQQR